MHTVPDRNERNKPASEAPVRESSLRQGLIGVALLRGALSLVAIPLAPFLYEGHFVALVLLRPTKEVLLVGGFLVREGDVALLPLVAAAHRALRAARRRAAGTREQGGLPRPAGGVPLQRAGLTAPSYTDPTSGGR